MVHKMQRMALSTNQLLPVKPVPAGAAKPAQPNSVTAPKPPNEEAETEGDWLQQCLYNYTYIFSWIKTKNPEQHIARKNANATGRVVPCMYLQRRVGLWRQF